MPYTIRKQKCKQSDGDSGGYTLSYTDNKGKKHRACHTSRKKAKGQIAAIEAEAIFHSSSEEQIFENEESTMNIKLSELRRIIREVLEEKKREDNDRDDDGDKDFADVMMARMTAGGVSKKKAVKKTRKYDE